MYYASNQAPRGEIADRRGAPSPIPHLIGESKIHIHSSAIRRPTSTSSLSANHIPRIKQPSTGEQLPSSCCGVSPVSASLVVCITANLLTRGALSVQVQDAQDPFSSCSLCPRRPRPFLLEEGIFFFHFYPSGGVSLPTRACAASALPPNTQT